jgi:beta-galactosidase
MGTLSCIRVLLIRVTVARSWLTIVDAVYIPLWGVSVASSQLDIKSFHEASSATVVVNATLVNTAATTAQTLVVVDILRADGSTVGNTQLNASIFAGATTTVSAKIVLGGTVELWSTDTPVMHRANVTVWSSTGDVDTSVVPFGVRQISFNSSHGFVLNNVATKM